MRYVDIRSLLLISAVIIGIGYTSFILFSLQSKKHSSGTILEIPIVLATSSAPIVFDSQPIKSIVTIVSSTQKEPANLFFTGDVMLGRYVETLRHIHGDDYVFSGLSYLWQDADVVAINLEGPISEQHRQTPNGIVNFSFDASVAPTYANT